MLCLLLALSHDHDFMLVKETLLGLYEYAVFFGYGCRTAEMFSIQIYTIQIGTYELVNVGLNISKIDIHLN